MDRRPSVRQRLALLREAVRGYWQGPIYSGDPALKAFLGGGTTTSAGLQISEDSALTYAAVWSATNCISGDSAALPLHMYQRTKGGGKDKFITNRLYRIVHDQPNPEMTSIAWRRTVQAHALVWGNGYSEIVRDGSGRPAELWPITPDRVTPYRRTSSSPLEYRVRNIDGQDSFIPAADMLHIPGLGFDGTQGYSVISKARESIGLGVAAEHFGSSLYGNGLAIGGVISFPGAKPPELADKNYVASLNSQHQGIERAHKLLALYNGAKYERMNIPPNDAQFLETRKFQISEIARWFNLPPHKLGDLERATHSNIEQQTIDYYTGTLLPWLKVWEQELNSKLVPSSERNIQFFEHAVDGLLRGDSQMRADSYSKRFNTGSLTPNDIREMENQNPLVGGETAFVPLNTIPMNLVQDWFQADIDEKKAKAEQARRPPPTPVAPTPNASPNRDAEIALLTEARDTARRCAQEAEDAKDIIAADLVKVQAEWAHARAEWETTQAELATTLAARDASLERSQESLSEYATRCGHLAGERDGMAVEVTRLTAQATALGTELATATRDLTAAREREALVEADYQRVCREKAESEAARDAALADAEQLARDRVKAIEERVEVQTELDGAIQNLTRSENRVAALIADAEGLAVARTHADEVNAATVTELRSQLATVTQDSATTTAALLDARTTIGTLEATRETANAAITEHEAARASHADELQRMRARLAQTQQALRGTLVDVADRLIAKEAERARKAQATPDKLAKWVETFYPIHEDFCRMALKPAVKAVLVAYGSEASVDRVIDGIVLSHISESSRQLHGVLQDSDIESLGPALERVLRRWEAERADALADRILKEAV